MSIFDDARSNRATAARAARDAEEESVRRNNAQAQSFKSVLDKDIETHASHLITAIVNNTITIQAKNGDWTSIEALDVDKFRCSESGLNVVMGVYDTSMGYKNTAETVEFVLDWVQIHP